MCDAVLSPRILISGADGKMSNYVRAVRAAGGTPVSGYCPPADLSCAGLLLCGGGDLDPVLYGQPDQGSQPPDPARDQAELELFRAFYQAGRPILGVCRGMQVINVALGGTRSAPSRAACSTPSTAPASPSTALTTRRWTAPPQGWSSPSGRWTAFPRPWSTPPSPFWGSSSTRSG